MSDDKLNAAAQRFVADIEALSSDDDETVQRVITKYAKLLRLVELLPGPLRNLQFRTTDPLVKESLTKTLALLRDFAEVPR